MLCVKFVVKKMVVLFPEHETSEQERQSEWTWGRMGWGSLKASAKNGEPKISIHAVVLCVCQHNPTFRRRHIFACEACGKCVPKDIVICENIDTRRYASVYAIKYCFKVDRCKRRQATRWQKRTDTIMVYLYSTSFYSYIEPVLPHCPHTQTQTAQMHAGFETVLIWLSQLILSNEIINREQFKSECSYLLRFSQI